MEQHGRTKWGEIERALASKPSCPKLESYWHFYDCKYHKTSGTCSEPDHIEQCPLPTHTLRNGRLNQTAYSLYLFIREIANNDLVGWIDNQLNSIDVPGDPDRLGWRREALLEPLRHVHGLGDKVLSMALSVLLLAAPRKMKLWAEVGAHMVAVDTLVHNFLVRTGILHRFSAGHVYGPACYQRGGCADIIQAVAQVIDARQFNPRFPATFPGSCNTRSGGTAPRTGSMCVTAFALGTTRVATICTAECVACATASPCVRIARNRN
jgi:hypothetical protein